MSKYHSTALLTEKEREDVYKYWLHSSTLTNEDGLIQLAEQAVMEKLAEMELPESETFETWNAKQHGDPEEIGFLQALRIAYCCGQDSVNQKQAFAQGAASVLSSEPVATVTDNFATDYSEIGRTLQEPLPFGLRLYTQKAPK